jgi:hypothetical protein
MTRRSNCVLCAVVLWLRMRQRWEAAGRPHGQEPYLLIRSSRLAPGWIPHVLVGRWSRTAPREMLVASFKPMDQRPLRWWTLVTVFRFHGRWTRGDS